LKTNGKILIIAAMSASVFGITFAISYPITLCNEIKEDFQENKVKAIEKYGYDSFEEWNASDRMALNEDCWWEGGGPY